MSNPSERFREICELRQLPTNVLVDHSLPSIALLALDNEDYAVPLFAAFKHLALPIAAEWILGSASAENKSTVFCRLAQLCPLWPPLQPLAEHFLTMNLQDGYVVGIFDAGNVDNALIGTIRLLTHNHGRFSPYFSAEELRNLAARDIESTRRLALHAVGLLTQVSESVVDEWLIDYIGHDSTDFEFNIILKEAQRKASDVELFQLADLLPSSSDYENALVANVESVFLPRFGQGFFPGVPFVRTATAVDNLRRIALTLLNDEPILLTGEPGSGKTFYSEIVHSRVRPGSEIVRIHLGDQTDAKALVGTYTTGSVPGTFEWSPGALTTAVKAGKWVLVEDIDRAPTDIVAVLLPLIDRRELVVPSRNQVIKASPGFQLLATTTNSEIEVIGSRGWARCNVSSPTDVDLVTILSSRRPFLSQNIVSMLLDVFRRIQDFQEKNKLARRVSTRDLFKLADRITPRYDGDDIFRETISCFASFMADNLPLARVVADSMGIASSKVEPLLWRHKPTISITSNELLIGRAVVERRPMSGSAARNTELQVQASQFALTGPTLRLLEEVAVSVSHLEPVLLVGETGTGKTSIIQYLAKLARRKLVVINVSQQVEAGDLIGGFKPVDARQLAASMLDEFYELFDATFSRAKNHQFVTVLERTIGRQQWSHVVKLLREAIKMASPKRQGGEAKRPKISGEWSHFSAQVDAFEKRVKEVQQQAQFQFIEGLLIRAMRQGHWVLLDELNLAPADTLEGIGELVSSRSLTLLEQSGEVVAANNAFRLFGNMNPATDVGKKDLPPGVRAQFTELWAPSPDSDAEALQAIISSYLPQGTHPSIVNDVSELYVDAKDLAESHQLVDGAGQRPHFSVRTLSRTLVCAVAIAPRFGLRRALFEAFSMCFLTLLEDSSASKLMKCIDNRLLTKLPNRDSVLSQTPAEPQDGHRYAQFKHWWMPLGRDVPQDDRNYIVTPTVERNLLNLVRATVTRMFPVLIQGPTSSGKTSMITHLARLTGHTVVRINNHEHTDLAEYLGGYESDVNGKLVFKEGALVTALRQGHWLILDELNLAPTDVLEALNRLLDDNRELLIPETQEVIQPHPDFILFATQNPPGLYAGRKVLSRAFRNRFLELHFGDIPESELEIILRDRSKIAPTYASKMVDVYRELGRRRSGARVFEHPATLRDLFRWANRPAVGYEELARNGFALLGERSRSIDERELVRRVLSDVLRVNVDVDYDDLTPEEVMSAAPPDIVWTPSMRRVLTLVHLALQQNEPVLLVGETGCGKTTIVQAIAAARRQKLTIVNAHQNTETGDLVGSQRPARRDASSKLFEWVDGPLVTSLKRGDFFLLDEISLADDSVLERLNSVLEADRSLFVPEIGSLEAAGGFQFFATMNPGGDYGKKELSPALRNRFTEIWVPSVDSDEDLRMIVRTKLQRTDEGTADRAASIIVSFSQYFATNFGMVSLRDVLSWTQFVTTLGVSDYSLVQGASMVFIDGLGSNAYAHLASQPDILAKAKRQCHEELKRLVGVEVNVTYSDLHLSELELSVGGFSISRNTSGEAPDFSLSAPTTSLNAMRVLRALQLKKPVLLEGSPGAGKTSLIAALAKLSGHKLTRINLSDQTDLADLFGSDIPLDKPGHFGWRDAPFLRAMQKGEWVLLDEMNLAPQQVLEGLNACLDHRGEAYVPELDKTFSKHPDFLVFAAQNPHAQGGGRKGLPKSFVNRFSVVYVEQLGLDDLYAISAACYSSIDASIREPLATFVQELANWTATHYVAGGPFEFNLRDTMRWLDLIARTGEPPARFLGLVAMQRFRTQKDRQKVEEMFRGYFPDMSPPSNLNPVNILPTSLTFGSAKANRTNRTFTRKELGILTCQIDVLETATYCVNQSWPLILVGPSGSGKTSVVRLLASLCGARLQEFAMTADIDSTDLLGEFDQVEEQSQLERLWSEFDESLDTSDLGSTKLVDVVRNRNLKEAVALLPEGHPLLDTVRDFQNRDYSKPTFQWFDGMLVRAVERGHWLVLDNANLCSPAVLDRLNSLLERGGSLLVNECAEADGSPREVIPHPNFRLFLTVDPRYGELSRAMRNRGTEVWMSPDMITQQDQIVADQRITSGALAVSRFSKPFNAAKFADLSYRSWLRTLLLDVFTAEHVAVVDHELSEFVKHFNANLCQRYAIPEHIDTLRRLWFVFHTREILLQAETVENPSNLLELSALRRRKDSVECDYDIFGFAVEACKLAVSKPVDELASVLSEFTAVKDPSRVPVYRKWFIDYGQKNCLPDFVNVVINLLGSAYDLSAGGWGLDKLWHKYSRQLGFANAEAHANFRTVRKLAMEFDKSVAPLSLKYSTAISQIRSALVDAFGSDQNGLRELQKALDAFKESLPQLESDTSTEKLLVDQFKGLFAFFALANAVEPSQTLQKTLANLSSFAAISTVDVYEITANDPLSVPAITCLPTFESIIIDAIQSDVQGAARTELSEIAQVLTDHGDTVSKNFAPTKLIGKLVRHNARLIAEAVPESHGAMAKIDELAETNPINACSMLAASLFELYVCPLPLDPAIAQHVWYERYLHLQSMFSEDSAAWDEIRRVFGVRDSIVDSWLRNRELSHVPVPTVYRPEQSTIAQVHRDMVAASQLAKNALRKPLTEDEREVIKRNANHLQDKFSLACEYRDLVAPVRTALALLTLSLSVPSAGSHAGNTWLLNPLHLGHRIPGLVPDYPLLVLRSLTCSDKPLIEPLREILDDIYRRWTLERLRVDEERREQAAGFRYEDDDGLAAEREFTSLFPDYEIQEYLPKQSDDFAPQLVSIYKSMFDGIKAEAVDISVDAAKEIKKAEGFSMPQHIAVLFLAVKDHLDDRKVQSTDINFYVDSSAPESEVSVEFAAKVTDRIRPMLNTWPEHDALQTILRVSSEICSLPPAVPVALHLAKVEQLHHWLYEWDRFAPKEAKVEDLISGGASLIVRWRRLELATWPALFAVERRKFVEENAGFFFHLYETLVVAPADDTTDVAKVLTVFMSEATIGQFEDRLEMLNAFHKHTTLLLRKDIARCVANIRGFYLQFLPGVNSYLAAAEKQLKKQVDDVVRLASWRDINVHALKQSAQRSHRQLFKIVKKYRSILSEKPPLQVQGLSAARYQPKSNSLSEEWNPDWLLPLKATTETTPWEARPKPLREIEVTNKVLRSYVKQVGDTELASLLELAENVEKQAQKLKSETPKSMNKENKKVIANLRVEKQQVLTATLRELRRAGLKPAMRKDTVMSQMELTRVLATTPNLSDARGNLASTEPTFFAFIELLPRLRAAVSDAANNPHMDVPLTDLQRGLVFTENAFAHILRLRRVAQKHLDVVNTHTTNYTLTELLEKAYAAELDLESASKETSKISSLMSTTCTLLDRLYEKVDAVMPIELGNLRAELSKNPHSELELSSSATLYWLENVKRAVETLYLRLSKSSSDSGVGPMAAPVLEDLQSELRDSAASVRRISNVYSTTEVDSAVSSAANAVLVTVQYVVRELEFAKASSVTGEDDNEDDEEWLIRSLSQVERLLLSLRPAQIVPKITHAAEMVLRYSAVNTELARSYAALLVAFVRGYDDLTLTVETLYSRSMSNTISGTLKLSTMLLSLASDGFCSPQDDSEDSDFDEGAEGTGLGDGTGAQSSSKDIDEEDDDVNEAMQTANPEQEDHDDAEDDEDNAKEVSGDMAGKTEDMPAQSDNEDENNTDEGEEEDPEDEIGDLEDLDPNAVDEKMWDDEKKEDADDKEKHTDNAVDGAKDDEAEARENEDEQNDDPSKEPTGNENAESEEDPEAEDAEEQDEEVKQGEQDNLENSAEQKEALDLPDDMDLDDEDAGSEDAHTETEDMDEVEDAEFDDPMDKPEDHVNDEATQDADAQDDDDHNPDEADTSQASREESGAEDDANMQEGENSASESEDMLDNEDIENRDQEDQGDMDMDLDDNAAMPDADADDNNDTANVEGLDGLNEEQSDLQKDQAASTDDRTQNKGKGANDDAATEEAHMGVGGSSGANVENSEQEPDASQTDPTSESLKTLGDAMKEFHRRNRPIRERGEENEENPPDGTEDAERPLQGHEELEHVGADDPHDTQALGRSNEQQDQKVDDELAIGDENDLEESKDIAGAEEEGAEKGAAGGEAEAFISDEEPLENEEPSAVTNPFSNEAPDELDEDEDSSERTATMEVTSSEAATDDLWQTYESKTHELALVLGEQLRLILEPTVASKLRGDFRTGKRLNMKRIIPYIASEFRKDKIWLRRTKPAKREYQVLLALDDSRSMGEPAVVDLAFQAIALVGTALSNIEAGQMGVAKFGSTTEFIHDLDQPFTPQAGNAILQQFGFAQQRTDVRELLQRSLDMFSEHQSHGEQWRLEIIVSDGITDDHTHLRRLVRRARDERVMLVFIVLDALNRDTSILDMNEVRYTTDAHGNQKLEVTKYMEDFPFEYYVIVRNIGDLPMVLASVLRQYFQAVEE